MRNHGKKERIFSATHLPVGSFYNAYVSHIEDGPYSFSVQLKLSTDKSLDKLSRRLKETDPVLNTNPLLPGTAVMTRAQRQHKFRRSIIMNVKRDYCLVYNLDYGNTEEVSSSNIYLLPSWAFFKSAKALQFCLSGISSLEVTEFEKMCFNDLLGKEVIIRVSPTERTGPLLQYCDVFYNCRTANDILFSKDSPFEYAIQYPTQENINEEVIVSHIVDASLFFIQSTKQLDTIVKINDAVTSYSQCITHLKDLSSVKVGSPVAAHFGDDIWCRGLVVGLEMNAAQVLFVDFGDTKKVPAGDMCLISKELVTTWSRQAIECCLQGFEDSQTNEVNEQIVSALEQNLGKKLFMMHLRILPDNRLLVELFDQFGGKISEKVKLAILHASCPPGSNGKNEQNSFEISKNAPDTLSLNPFQYDRGKMSNFYVCPSQQPYLLLQNSVFKEKFFDDKKTISISPNPFGLPPFHKIEEKETNICFDKSQGLSVDSGYEGFRSSIFSASTSYENENAKSNEQEKGLTLCTSNMSAETKLPQSSAGNIPYKDEDFFNKEFQNYTRMWKTDETSSVGSNKKSNSPLHANKCRSHILYKINSEFLRNKNCNESQIEMFEEEVMNRERVDKWLTSGSNPFISGFHVDHFKEKKFDRFSKETSLNSSLLDSSKISSLGSVTTSSKKLKKEEKDSLASYPLPKITSNTELQVFVSSIVNPHYFYVQKAGCEKDLDQMRSAIDSFSKVLKPVQKEFLGPGVPVLARFSDDKALYRGLVKRLFLPKGAQVLFVDYGNFEIVSTNDLYYVPPEILSKRPLSVCCKLPNISPNGRWPGEVGAFDAYFITEDSLKMTVSSTKFIDGEMVVAAELAGADGISVSQRLIDSGIAVPVSS